MWRNVSYTPLPAHRPGSYKPRPWWSYTPPDLQAPDRGGGLVNQGRGSVGGGGRG